MQPATRPRRIFSSPLFIAWMAIPLVAALGLLALLIPRGTSTSAQPVLLGTVIQKPTVAPNFALHDQHGATVGLRSLRGKTVIVTFVESHCSGLCPRVVDKLHQLDVELGRASRHVAILAISVDPENDTPASIRTFSRQHGMWHRWLYLTASRTNLKGVWRNYYVYAAPPGSSQSLDAQHTAVTYLIDATGHERVLMGGDIDEKALQHDVRYLLGLPLNATSALDAAPVVGHPAPDFNLRTTGGSTISLADLRGKVVLLNFWATWCHPCRSEMPRLSGWYMSMHSKGFTVVGIDSLQSPGVVSSYARSLQVRYPVVLDGDGNVAAAYDIVAMPTSYLIDRRGIVRARFMGGVNDTFLRKHVQPVLAAGAHAVG